MKQTNQGETIMSSPNPSDADKETCPYCEKTFATEDMVLRKDIYKWLDYPRLCWGCATDLKIECEMEEKSIRDENISWNGDL